MIVFSAPSAAAVIVVVPSALAVTTPFSTDTIAGSATVYVTSCTASSGATVAEIFLVLPFIIENLSSLGASPLISTVTSSALGAVTVTAHSAVKPPSAVLTVIVAVPCSTAVTTPFKTVATFSSEVDHVTVLTSASAGVIVSVSVTVSPFARETAVLSRETPVTGTATSFGVTVNVIVSLTGAIPKSAFVYVVAAVMSTVFSSSTIANVTLPSASTVATVSSLDVNFTALSKAFAGAISTSRVTLSPPSTAFVEAPIVTLVTATGLTVTSQEAVFSPSFVVTVIVALPTPTGVTTPSATVATASSEDVHVTVLSVAFSGATVAVRVLEATSKPSLPFANSAVVSSKVTLSTATD